MRFWQTLAIHLLIAIAAAPSTRANSAEAQWSTLSGQFVYGDMATEVPVPPPLIVGKNNNVCCKFPLVNETLVVNAKNHGIANIVIWAYKPTSVHPALTKPPAKPAVVLNKNCRFEPHVTLVRAGQDLRVGNPDPVAHNAMVAFLKNRGENPLIPPNGTVTIIPKKAEIIPIKISCSIHPWMQGIVLVQDHPYMVKTDKDGKFELNDLPSGEVTLKIWHEKLGYVKSFTLDNQEKIMLKRGQYVVNLPQGAKEKHVYKLDPKLFAAKR